ncbi:complement C1q tumor necrosis factor-related protein 3-like [Colossoma macropomum]|uniref:complement C1q tumor necrosis factor-related protein 3-like n=1 Tax=Colossoma macropomum TaxID=42526 RepID=UPI001865614E|nr:complement C1q tumor necrosis factor-related protein 3-like [Colossoma macropomum]
MEQKLDSIATQFTDMMEELRREIREVGKLQDLEKRQKTMEATLEELKKDKEKKVAFSASLLASGEGHTGPMNPVPSPLIYKKVSSNYGNGYDPNTEVEKLQDLEKRLKNVEETLEKEKEKKVAFSASLLASGEGHTGPMNPVPSPLIYKKVFSNYGNGYDSNTGIFTAPIKGVYFFRFYAFCHPGTKMAVSLYKNDERQCSVFTWKPVTNGNASNGIVLTLEEGDRIYTKLWDDTWVNDDPNGYTSFSGFLLFPL